MNKLRQLVVFTLDEGRYALDPSAVERVLRAVEITPLPKTSEFILGVVNLQGQITPVVNIRKWFRLPERDISLSDQLIIVRTSNRTLALVVDAVIGVVEGAEQEVIAAERILPHTEDVEGVAKLEGGMAIVLHNLDRLLSFAEEKVSGDVVGTGAGE